MNFGELKKEVRDLGFEEDPTLEEYKSIIINATNRALRMINATVLPVIGRYDFEQDGTVSGIQKYDLLELTKEDGKAKFLAFTDTPVRINDGDYSTFNNFEVEENHIIVMDGATPGAFSIFYKKIPAAITEDTTDDTELEIDERMVPALAFLVAHYVWLDDDERKATQYYNEYDAYKAEIMQEQPAKARIMGGF